MYKKNVLNEIKDLYNRVNISDDDEKDFSLPQNNIFENMMLNDIYNHDLQILGEQKLLKNDTGIVLLAGGGGTRVLESLKILLNSIKNGKENELTSEEKCTLNMFKPPNSLDILETNETKLVLPITPIKNKSPMVLNLESLSSLSRDFNSDLKIVIIVGPTTIHPIKELLIKNDNFGIKNIVIKPQGLLPCINERTSDFILKENGEYLSSANGGGGVFEALFDLGLNDAFDNIVYDKSAIEWFKESSINDILIAQTDDSKEKEVYKALLGVKKNMDEESNVNNLVCMAYHYPKKYSEINGEIEFSFKLGSFWKVFCNNKHYYKIFEFNELLDEQRRLITENFKKPSLTFAASSGCFVVPIELCEKIYTERLLMLHLQRNKYEEQFKVTKFEYFLPDIVEIATKNNYNLKLLMLRDTSNLSGRLKDTTVDSMPIKDISKLSLAYEAKKYIDKKKLLDLGALVHEDAIVEVSSLSSFKIGKNVVLEKGAKLYIGGEYEEKHDVTIGDFVLFSENCTVIIEGDKDVNIDDGVIFEKGSIVNL